MDKKGTWCQLRILWLGSPQVSLRSSACARVNNLGSKLSQTIKEKYFLDVLFRRSLISHTDRPFLLTFVQQIELLDRLRKATHKAHHLPMTTSGKRKKKTATVIMIVACNSIIIMHSQRGDNCNGFPESLELKPFVIS